MPRWLLPVLLAVVCAASATASVRLAATGGAGARGPAVLAPVLSARRVPAFLARMVADTRLRSQLDAAMAEPALGAARDRSCLIVRHGPRSVLERRPAEPLIPASNLKVLTASAVLSRLGPDAVLVTEVRAAAAPAVGVVDGPLYLVGGGDPLLGTADYAASFENQPQVRTPLEGLADAVVAAGVTVVRGGVVGDETRYDTQRYVPTWKPGYITDSESGPASALVVNDGFAQFRPRRLAAPEPDVHAAGALAALLQARGVTVEGPVGEGRAPDGAGVVAKVESPPMRALVAQMLRESDNLTAELLVKELGHRFAGAGSTTAGVGVVRETLTRAGFPVDQFVSVDGSGLDRQDRASCGLVMAALESSGPTGAVSAGLAVAARDGTLAKRFLGENPAAGRLRAKTGALDGVVGLSGFVDAAAAGDPLGFSLLVNDLPRDALGRALQEQVGAILARYPEAPTAEALAP